MSFFVVPVCGQLHPVSFDTERMACFARHLLFSEHFFLESGEGQLSCVGKQDYRQTGRRITQ